MLNNLALEVGLILGKRENLSEPVLQPYSSLKVWNQILVLHHLTMVQAAILVLSLW